MQRLLLPLCVLTAITTACKSQDSSKVDVNVPKIEVPAFDANDVLKKFRACDQADTANAPAHANVDLIKQTQRIQRLGCDGRFVSDAVETVMSARTILTLNERRGLGAPVASIKINNLRTCQNRSGKASDAGAQLTEDQLVLIAPAGPIALPSPAMQVGKHGELQIVLEDASSWLFVNESLPVREGLNSLNVVYFDANNRELASSEIRLNFRIRETQLNGIKTLDVCPRGAK